MILGLVDCRLHQAACCHQPDRHRVRARRAVRHAWRAEDAGLDGAVSRHHRAHQRDRLHVPRHHHHARGDLRRHLARRAGGGAARALRVPCTTARGAGSMSSPRSSRSISMCSCWWCRPSRRSPSCIRWRRPAPSRPSWWRRPSCLITFLWLGFGAVRKFHPEAMAPARR